MKKLLPYFITALLAAIIVWQIMDARNGANLDEAERRAAERVKTAETLYKAEADKADGFAAEVQRLLNLPEKIQIKTVTRTVTQTEAIPGSLPDIIISPRDAFPGLAGAIDSLIASHYILRREHDIMVEGLRDIIDIKQAQINRSRWGWSVGFQGGVSFAGSPYIGFGATWGRRL